MTFLLPRLARAVLAGIGTTYETLIPGPSIHGYRLDAAEVPAEAEAEQEVSEPKEWYDLGAALRAAHIKHGRCASRNPNDPPHVATICDERLGHDGDHRHGMSEFWPNETSAVTPPAAVDDPAGGAPASAPQPSAGSPPLVGSAWGQPVPAGVSARPKNVAPSAGLDPAWADSAICDVLAAHAFWPANHSSIGMEGHCRCGARPHGLMEWREHVAPLIVNGVETARNARLRDLAAPLFEIGLDMGVSVASEFFPQHRREPK